MYNKLLYVYYITRITNHITKYNKLYCICIHTYICRLVRSINWQEKEEHFRKLLFYHYYYTGQQDIHDLMNSKCISSSIPYCGRKISPYGKTNDSTNQQYYDFILNWLETRLKQQLMRNTIKKYISNKICSKSKQKFIINVNVHVKTKKFQM